MDFGAAATANWQQEYSSSKVARDLKSGRSERHDCITGREDG